MNRQAFLSDLQTRLVELLRSSPAADLERNLKALLGQTFQRLELVTREELKDDARVKKLGEALTSQRIQDFIKDTYQGSVLPAAG